MTRRGGIEPLVVDVAVIGAGISGLWLANLLAKRGFSVALCDDAPVGGIQTAASQGVIHSGAKYALGAGGGAPTALAAMPARWRACLAGNGEVDLRGVAVAAEHMHLLARGTAPRTPDLPDFALNVPSLIRGLAEPLRHRLLAVRVEPRALALGPKGVTHMDVGGRRLCAGAYLFAAGVGNEALARSIGVSPSRTPAEGSFMRGASPSRVFFMRGASPSRTPAEGSSMRGAGPSRTPAEGSSMRGAGPSRTPAEGSSMRRRALRQTCVRLRGVAPKVFAHCFARATGAAPELTVTSHDRTLYVGGTVADDGAARTDAEHVAVVRALLAAHLPAIDLTGARFDTLLIDRAEPAAGGLGEEADAFVARHGNCLICWPVKLSLAPRLGDKVLAELEISQPAANPWPGHAGTVLRYATPPWERKRA